MANEVTVGLGSQPGKHSSSAVGLVFLPAIGLPDEHDVIKEYSLPALHHSAFIV